VQPTIAGICKDSAQGDKAMNDRRSAARKVLAAALAFAALVLSNPANAELLDPAPAYPTRPDYPTKFVNTALLYDWTGFYAGINGGGSFGRTTWASDPDFTSGSVNVASGLAGGTMGYNMQNLGRLVVGEEFDFDWRSFTAHMPAPSCVASGGDCEFTSRWVSTARIRFGYMVDTFLPYVTGGVAITDVNQGIVGHPLGIAQGVSYGWTVGAGLEFALTGALTAKIEYLYLGHALQDCTSECGVGPVFNTGNIHMGLSENIFRVGLNYRFWGR
jgi:outer membrane immunogenic protein